MAEERNTDPKMATSQPRENNGDGRKVFLHNLDDTETYGVHFGVNLHQKDGRFVFKDFLEGGMAYKTGFRSGDVLVSANSIDIDNVDLMQLLKELLDYKEFNYIIGVERKLDDGENTKFIWKIFKIFPKGKFFQYSYTDPGTGTCGNVVAYSLDDSFRRDVQSSPATFKNLKRMTVLDFPKYMTGKHIPPNARFFYKLVSQGGFSLQSMIAPGMYLGIGPDDEAILKRTPTSLLISRDGGACKQNTVE
ncbi:uncharacterized protein LOC117295996 isoform X3 [Asterias rubens]|uniref:uncharacterized protein LOC117295996 isoform X3 n=1 Tax=Asterias rubens TaxID=7604 RepID=UPI0014551176|nr:uncharacterized protein LOC117295996 isoform X3 [Asterias rubens]